MVGSDPSIWDTEPGLGAVNSTGELVIDARPETIRPGNDLCRPGGDSAASRDLDQLISSIVSRPGNTAQPDREHGPAGSQETAQPGAAEVGPAGTGGAGA